MNTPPGMKKTNASDERAASSHANMTTISIYILVAPCQEGGTVPGRATLGPEAVYERRAGAAVGSWINRLAPQPLPALHRLP